MSFHEKYIDILVHTAYGFFSDVSEFFFILRVFHHLDALHGGVLVLVGQELGLAESLGLTDQLEGGLDVSRLAEPPEDQLVELRELLASEQHGRRGQAQAQVCC